MKRSYLAIVGLFGIFGCAEPQVVEKLPDGGTYIKSDQGDIYSYPIEKGIRHREELARLQGYMAAKGIYVCQDKIDCHKRWEAAVHQLPRDPSAKMTKDQEKAYEIAGLYEQLRDLYQEEGTIDRTAMSRLSTSEDDSF